MGFDARRSIYTFEIEKLPEDLPIIEIVDTREKLEAYIANVDSAIEERLATMEKEQVRFYRIGDK